MPNALMLVNPHKRRKVRKNPSHRRHHYRRNPESLDRVTSLLKPAFVGAGGALLTNAASNYLGQSILPASFYAGPMIFLTKAGIAMALGMVGEKFMTRETALKMTEGSLTVIAAQALQFFALSNLGVNLSGAGYLGPGRVVSRGVGKYLSGTGKYLSGSAGGSDMGSSRDFVQAGARIIPLR